MGDETKGIQDAEVVDAVTNREVLDLQREREIDWVKLVAKAEQQVEAYKKFRVIMLRMLAPKDVDNIDGNPFVQESGAQALAGPFGVNMDHVSSEKTWADDAEGKRYYVWTYRARFYSKKIDREIWAEGICSSRDQFFGKAGGEFKEVDDVPESHIQYKAVASLNRRGILSLLGLKNIQWTELAAAGMDITKCPRVEHKLGGKSTGKADAAIAEAMKGKPNPPPPPKKEEPKKEPPKKEEPKAPPKETPKETPKENGKPPAPKTYPPEIVELVGKLINHIFNTNNMEELGSAWKADKDDREKLRTPEFKSLYDDIVKAKDEMKAAIQKKEAEKKGDDL